MESYQLTVVVPTTHTQDELKDYLRNLYDTVGCSAEIVILGNSEGVSLTKLYNDSLRDASTDIVVFMHDDIQFLKKGWGAEVVRMFSEHRDYGIIGVAGTTYFRDNCQWWTNPESYGQVMHRNGENTFLTIFSPRLSNDLEQVVLVDGVFMAVERTRISQTFDEDFQGFHFYDIGFCLANFFDHKTKIGVTTNIKILHNSMGATNEQWMANRLVLLNKYKGRFPVKLK